MRIIILLIRQGGIKKFKEDPPEANFLTQEEYMQVLKNSVDIAKPWIRFMACTGLRATEFCNLRWKNCDIKNKTITIIGKGRKKRSIGLNNTALGILKEARAGRPMRSTISDMGTQITYLKSDFTNRQFLNSKVFRFYCYFDSLEK